MSPLPRFFDRVSVAVGRIAAVEADEIEPRLAQPVGIRLPDVLVHNENIVWTAQMVGTLVARLFPNVVVAGAPEYTAPVRALMVAINPQIDVDVSSERLIETADVVDLTDDVLPTAVVPRSSGWVAGVSRGVTTGSWGAPNPFAAGAAGCFAVSELFRTRVAQLCAREAGWSYQMSLLDFGQSSGSGEGIPPLDLGHVAVVGVGGVGSAMIWALARCAGLSGTLDLVDDQDVDVSNLQRYLLTRDVDAGVSKVEIAARECHEQGSGLDVRPRKERLEGFAASVGDVFSVASLAVSVDSVSGRRSAQALLPKLVVNGWTSESGLGTSSHEFDGVQPCLACLYHPQGPRPSQTDMVAEAVGLAAERTKRLWISPAEPLTAEDASCIVAHLQLSDDLRDALVGKSLRDAYTAHVCGMIGVKVGPGGQEEAVPVAHQSALTGVLLAAELVKRLSPQLAGAAQTFRVTAWDDVLGGPPADWRRPVAVSPDCFCQDAVYRDVFEEKWGDSD